MSGEALHREICERGGVADLSARCRLELRGADRVRYLNGQASADVRQLGGSARAACLLTVKGKLVALAHISATDESLRLDVDPDRGDAAAARLERYIIADDVTLEDVSAEWSLLHVLGDGPEGIPSRRLGREGRDLWVPAAERDGVWAGLAARFPVIDDEAWELLRIEAGVPRWGAELDEDTLPAEAGLDRTAVDFHKGCYVGQEVVSRMESAGRVNRKLRGFTSDTPLSAGMRLFDPAAPEADAGWLTSAAWSFALARPIALGYLKRGAAADSLAARHPGGAEAAAVRVHDLPFQS